MFMNASIERANPPPRRKSCEACKVAKRRCDLGFPACSRCARRNQPCVYPGQQPAAVGAAPPLGPPPLEELLGGDTIGLPYAEPQCLTEFSFSPMPDFGIPTMDLVSNVNSEQDVVHSCSDLAHQVCYELEVSRTRDSAILAGIISSRLEFALNVLKEIPRKMVLENETPWCHRQLYAEGMPKEMQDAYACCALYMAKNGINAPVIVSSITGRIQDLLMSPAPATPLALLARTHALLIYQIMALSDAEIRSHIATGPSMSLLESSAVELFKSAQFPDPSAPDEGLPSTLDPLIDFWRVWTFEESTRRTMFFTFFIIQLHKVLFTDQTMICDGRLGITSAWYLSAHLWNAQSAFDFAVAWTEKRHFLVYNIDFREVLDKAQASDVDSFGKMLMVTLLGIDKARAWFYTRGAIL